MVQASSCPIDDHDPLQYGLGFQSRVSLPYRNPVHPAAAGQAHSCGAVLLPAAQPPAPYAVANLLGEQMKMNRSVLRSILAAITSAACLVPFVIGGTAQAAWAGCQGGSMLGKGTTKLSNGFLEVWFCRYSNGRIGNVHISYSKTGGTSVIRLRFMWDRATANGIGQGIVQKDQGSFVQSTGQTRDFTWHNQSPGVGISGYCARGVLRQYHYRTGSLVNTYSTRVVCF